MQGEGGGLVIRPEHLRLGADVHNNLSGRVKELVYAGSETRVIAQLGDGQEIVLRLLPGQSVPGMGDAISVGWDKDAAALVP